MAPTSAPDLVVPATGIEARLHCRSNTWNAPTAGIAPGHLQANLIALPSYVANDFRLLCASNPVPCPLLACSAKPGDFANFISHIPGIPASKVASGLDIRFDIARYNVYLHGQLVARGIHDVEAHWDVTDHVAFLIGCSFSFENALGAAGLPLAHVVHARNIPMYRTNIPLNPAGIFEGSNYIVSMRFYRRSQVQRVRDVTREYIATHGEPIAWGWESADRLAIADIDRPDWGDSPLSVAGELVRRNEAESEIDGLVPVFWGCGVTPQEAVMRARILGVVIGHSPGHMLVLDVKEEDVLCPS